MKVPFLDLPAQYREIRTDAERALESVFASQQFVLGPAVGVFEREMEAYTGARRAIGVASGSDALLLALMALGIGPGDAVVTTPFSFFATASAVVRVGARLLFADIDPSTFNLSSESIARTLDRIREPVGRLAILPVHLFGCLAPIEEICALARERGARVVEDAAQSTGARRQSRMAGTFGDAGALSFFPSKNLGGAGDGGMVLTSDDAVAARVEILRAHGSHRRYEHQVVGVNSRLDSLQAALLSVKLRRLDEWNHRRRDRVRRYNRLFRERGLEPGPIRTPQVSGDDHVFHQYVIRAEDRDGLRAALAEAGVETQVYYPIALHRQPCFAHLGWKAGDFPEAERATREVLALPIYPELADDQVEYVVAKIAEFYARPRA